jgi:hypothetical protein
MLIFCWDFDRWCLQFTLTSKAAKYQPIRFDNVLLCENCMLWRFPSFLSISLKQVLAPFCVTSLVSSPVGMDYRSFLWRSTTQLEITVPELFLVFSSFTTCHRSRYLINLYLKLNTRLRLCALSAQDRNRFNWACTDCLPNAWGCGQLHLMLLCFIDANTCIMWWSQLQVKFSEERPSFLHFLTNVCAIVGGKVNHFSPLCSSFTILDVWGHFKLDTVHTT